MQKLVLGHWAVVGGDKLYSDIYISNNSNISGSHVDLYDCPNKHPDSQMLTSL